MNEKFFPGPIDDEAIYGLSLHSDRLGPVTADALSHILRRELKRCLSLLSPVSSS